MDRFRMLPNYQYHDDDTGILETQYKKEIRDYQICGNSIQDGTPSPDNPIEIQSVGEKTKNLFNINNIATNSEITNNGDGSLTVKGYPSTTSKTLKELCPHMKVGQTIVFSMITNGYIQVYLRNKTNEFKTYLSKNQNFIVTEDILNSILYLYRQTSAQGGKEATIYNIQFEEGTKPTSFEPYGYKIPIEVSGKNLFNETKFIDLGFELQEDGRYFGNSYTIGAQTIWTNTEGLKGSFYIDGVMTSHDGVLGYAIRTFYTDGTSMWGFGLTNENKIVDYVQLSYSRQKEMYLSNFIIANTSIETSYEPYKEPENYNIFLDEPLRKCGDYADYIDFRNGKVIRNIFLGYITTASFIHSKVDPSKGNHCCMTMNKETSNNRNLLANTPLLAISFPNASNRWNQRTESIFTHSILNGYLYLKVNWDRLGLVYDGTTVYVDGDETQTALTDKEIVTYFTQYLNTLSKKEKEFIYIGVQSQPFETAIDLPKPLLNKGTNIIKVKTATEPSEVNWQYYK